MKWNLSDKSLVVKDVGLLSLLPMVSKDTTQFFRCHYFCHAKYSPYMNEILLASSQTVLYSLRTRARFLLGVWKSVATVRIVPSDNIIDQH